MDHMKCTNIRGAQYTEWTDTMRDAEIKVYMGVSLGGFTQKER